MVPKTKQCSCVNNKKQQKMEKEKHKVSYKKTLPSNVLATGIVLSGLPSWLRWQSVCLQCGKSGFDPWAGKFPEEGNGNPLQYSCLENPMDGGAWCPWGRKELDTTERVHFTSLQCFLLIGVEGGYFKSPFTLRSILFWSICKSK